MERGLFIAASGMLAAQIRQDVIANNLANATNAGFKADIAVGRAFDDMLLHGTIRGNPIGPLTEGTQIDEVVVDSRPGGLRATQNPLDLAVVGNGWFSVRTAAGVAYTRNGSFTTNAQGQIVTAQGDPVLGVDGQPITVPGTGKLGIDRQGRVLADNRPVGQIAVTSLAPASLRKLGSNYLQGTPDTATPPGEVAQGYLEGSNVNTVSEMVDLIVNMRSYEADQKAVKAEDDALDRAANQVGRV